MRQAGEAKAAPAMGVDQRLPRQMRLIASNRTIATGGPDAILSMILPENRFSLLGIML